MPSSQSTGFISRSGSSTSAANGDSCSIFRKKRRPRKSETTSPFGTPRYSFLSCHFRDVCSFSVELMGRSPREICPLSFQPKNRRATTVRDKYCLLIRATLSALLVTVAFTLSTTAIAQAPPGSLWYNGDYNYVNALAHERNTGVSQAAVYDDFNVTSPL